MHRHFENWNDMKHEPWKFWSAETIFSIYAKLFPYMISDNDHRRPFSDFTKGRGWSVHRLAGMSLRAGCRLVQTAEKVNLPPPEFANQNKDIGEF